METKQANVRKPGYYWVKVYNSDDFTIARYVHNDIWIHEGRAHSEKYFDEIDLEPITRNETSYGKGT